MNENKFSKHAYKFGFALLLVAAAVGWFVNRGGDGTDEVQVSDQEKTEVRAFEVGKTLIEKNFELVRFVAAGQKRNVASSEDTPVEAVTAKVEEGEYGRDAWGHPFYFKVLDGKVYVWSKGENHKLDSTLDQLTTNTAAGDDIVVSIAL